MTAPLGVGGAHRAIVGYEVVRGILVFVYSLGEEHTYIAVTTVDFLCILRSTTFFSSEQTHKVTRSVQEDIVDDRSDNWVIVNLAYKFKVRQKSG